ncbi:ABC transporter substrate-binding protein [Aeromicrobium sp. CTD01-1L150]|uniref:peptide ABC transporter substrate-binding protein n=1 Tax=Aeromicrobium sp. CTD01-1L150 TaxID=3341830 RepID=UPI0035BEC07F
MRLTRRTRLAGVALFATGSLVLAACGGGGDDGGDGVVSVYGTEPQNPLIGTSTNEVGGGNVIDQLFAGLVVYDNEGESSLEVAESIESEDNQTWTITLKDWEFSDGTPVTANSFVDAWNYGALSTNAQLSGYFFEPIEGYEEVAAEEPEAETLSGLEVVDDKTFTVELAQPEADFPERLGYSAYFPVPESAFDDMEAYGEAPIGNGPYKLAESGWERNQQITLEPNESYEGTREPQNNGIIFKIYTDPDGAYSDIQAGNLDLMDNVPPSALATYQDDDQVQPVTQPGSSNATITIPERLDGFDGEEGKLRRQAISKAINRAEITETVFEGSRTPAVDFSAPVMPGFIDDIEGSDVLEFDAEEAKDLWAQAEDIAPYEGTFTLAYNADGPGNKEWVEALVNQLRNNLEIDAEPEEYASFDEFREDITNRDIETAFRTGWQADYPSIYNYLAPLYGTGAGSNDGDYSSEEFDGLLREAAGASEEEERFDLYAQAQAVLFEDLPVLPLWYTDVAAAASQSVDNVTFNWKDRPVLHEVTKD